VTDALGAALGVAGPAGAVGAADRVGWTGAGALVGPTGPGVRPGVVQLASRTAARPARRKRRRETTVRPARSSIGRFARRSSGEPVADQVAEGRRSVDEPGAARRHPDRADPLALTA
jgi:hypothetical protein